MKPIDITKQILAMHEDEVMNNMLEEVKNELKDTIPSDIQATLDACMQKLSNEGDVTPSNVLSFKPKSTPSIISFAETELLAASGKSLADWFSQPINFAGVGFILDIRRVFGTKDEIDLYLSPTDSERMSASFDVYKGKSLKLTITNNDKPLLTAELYIDDTGQEAEGSGQLIDLDGTPVQGKISIDIEVIE
ncbi:hypothetical protein FGD67_21175 [Colwellia sp. M166]|uniref:hypothetical protein n=1 Tax=Colwellia sp. M166 TaxID=2583805 RepID=UPI00211E6CB6|nr:hypothetical protein [Colwellia sp. M166]UUO25446.1 hypothetical protein FGD67_21175 [Colwellia sp. M166]